MIYLLETDLLENKTVYISLTKVYGIGKSQALSIIKKLGFACNFKTSKLSSEQIVKLIKLVENLKLVINNNLKKSKIMITKKLIQIKAYKGIRKLKGLPVRGQRTHTNAKTASKFR
jgi:small subunit ribosomal protein S13